LRLPKLAMSTIEQIVICKLMLFSYIYHHQKVRAAEGLLIRLLERSVSYWRESGKADDIILERFLSATDASLSGELFLLCSDAGIANYSYRIINRLVPREVYRLSPAFSHAEGSLIKDFFTRLQDRSQREEIRSKLENEIGGLLVKLNKGYGDTPAEALWKAGVWLDVPKVPKFEDMSVLVGDTKSTGVPISDLFPISHWVQAYQSHRFYVRIYAFSEAFEDVAHTAQLALVHATEIKDPSFYKSCLRSRS